MNAATAAKTPHALRGVLCAALGGVLWGFSGTCGQYLFMHYEVNTLWLTALRMLTAGVVLTALALLRHRQAVRGLWHAPADLAQLALYAVGGLVLCQFSYMTAISWSNAATTTVLQSLGPVLILLLVCLRTRRHPNRREGIALALAVGGTYLLATGGDPTHMALSGRGLFWGLMTAAAVACYTLLPARILPKWGAQTVTGCGMLIGGAVVLLAARTWRFSVALPWDGWLAVGGVAVVGTVGAFSLFMQGVADVGPVKSSMLSATEPLTATVLSALWLGTRFSAADLIGFACITATVFLLADSR